MEGLKIAYLNIDEVIRIIREEDNPKKTLMKVFKLTDSQADGILNLRLRNLAKLEEEKIVGELEGLLKTKSEISEILSSKRRLKSYMKAEIKEEVGNFKDRRHKVVGRPAAQELDVTQLFSPEAITVILSKNGWIRAAKGHDVKPDDLGFKSGDELLTMVSCINNHKLLIFDSTGRSYSFRLSSLPSGKGLWTAFNKLVDTTRRVSFYRNDGIWGSVSSTGL